MEEHKSSDVRAKLNRFLTRVMKEDVEIGIEHNGAVVAKLTCHRPSRKIPPIHIKAEEAKSNWADLIAAVSIRSARFEFRNSRNNSIIYIVPMPGAHNEFADRWRAHATKWAEKNRAEPMPVIDTIDIERSIVEEMQAGIAMVNNRMAHLFALVNRGGDLMNTPELCGPKPYTAGDLGRY